MPNFNKDNKFKVSVLSVVAAALVWCSVTPPLCRFKKLEFSTVWMTEQHDSIHAFVLIRCKSPAVLIVYLHLFYILKSVHKSHKPITLCRLKGKHKTPFISCIF